MTSHDVRDMLDLPGAAAPRPAKKAKVGVSRSSLKGLAREIQSLGGDNPIAIVPEVSVFKKRRLASRKPAAKWELKPFVNSARDDGLVLKHWRRKAEARPAAPEEDGAATQQDETVPEPALDDSGFAKFNVRANILRYNDEQYNAKLQSEDWSRDETDYLMDLVQEYDLRWPVIWDRYEYAPAAAIEGSEDAVMALPKARSLEDLKARYYKVAANLMKLHKPLEQMTQADFDLHELMETFNPAQEAARKKFAEAAFHRTKEEASEEQSLLLELKRILARSDRLSEERRELYARLEAPPSTGNIGLYTTSQGLQQLLQQLMTVDKSKKRKSLMGPEGVSPAGPSGFQPPGGFDRRDSSNRESMPGPSATNKKGSAHGASERRVLTEEEERVYGVSHHDRIGTSGPAFRHEKLNRPISTKSSAQQAKISNTLNELEVPGRLIMPTADVGAVYEGLLHSINVMLDSRKVVDKLAGEINLLKAQKLEREKKERAERGEPEPGVGQREAEQDAEQDGDGGEDGEGGDGGAEEDIKMEDGEKEKSDAPSTRAGSAHKRSASVLSAVSDKSMKRQKK